MALLDMYEQARVSASEFEEKHSEFSESLARELSFRRVDRVQPVAHGVQRSALQEIKPSQQQDSPQAVHRLSAKSTDDISSSPQSGRFAMRRTSPRSARAEANAGAPVAASPQAGRRLAASRSLVFSSKAPDASGDAGFSSGLDRNIEVIKRDGSDRVGIQLEKVKREVVICTVLPGSPAELAGLGAGDTLIAVDGTAVASATKAAALIAASKGSTVLTTRGVAGTVDGVLIKESGAAPQAGFSVGYDGRSRQVKVTCLLDFAACELLEVGDVLIAVNGVRIERSASGEKTARETVRDAPAGAIHLRFVRAERAITESLGLVGLPDRTSQGSNDSRPSTAASCASSRTPRFASM